MIGCYYFVITYRKDCIESGIGKNNPENKKNSGGFNFGVTGGLDIFPFGRFYFLTISVHYKKNEQLLKSTGWPVDEQFYEPEIVGSLELRGLVFHFGIWIFN